MDSYGRSSPGDTRRRPADENSPPRKRPRQHDVEDQLCARCRALMSSSGIAGLHSTGGFEHLARDEAEDNAAAGCALCWFLAAHASPSWTPGAVLRLAASAERRRDEAEGETQGDGGLDRFHGIVDGDVVVQVAVFAREDDPAASLIRRRPVEGDIAREEVWDCARRQIAACLKSHPRCHDRGSVPLPTRVLDVGTSEEPRLRLRENAPGEEGTYLALSYCWGGDQQLKTTNGNVQALRQKIAVEDLTVTIQDAVQTARRLGFCYLWVDALCIIQDDEVDKAKELSRMAGVYRDAAATIAASVAACAADGFLYPRDEYGGYFDLRFPVSDGHADTVAAGERTGTALFTTAVVPEHPLDTRGWAWQEFLLSQRLLLFSDHEVLWQCHSEDLRGVVPGGLEYVQPLEGLPFDFFARHHREHQHLHRPASLGAAAAATFGTADHERFYVWKTIVEQYTDRHLSLHEDRPRAIAAVADELRRLWKDRYLFGLWRRWFVELLAWRQPEKQQTAQRSGRAPTWSWISVDGAVCFEDQPLVRTDAKFIDESLLTLRSGRGVALLCRIVAAATLPLGHIEDVNENRDLAGDESEIGGLHYLLLGYVGDNDVSTAVGLTVLETGPGVFSRRGYAEFGDDGIWDDCPKDRVVLT